MGTGDRPRETLRLERTESNRLLRALLLSALLHLLVAGTWKVGQKLHWWDDMRVPRWMQAAKFIPPPQTAAEKARREAQEQPPTVFIQVSPRQATTEAPKSTPFYSTKNSLAANPTQNKNLEVPKIEGSQEQAIRTEDVRRDTYTALQPVLPQQPVPQPKPLPPEPEEKPEPAQDPGDIALARPNTNNVPKQPTDPGQSKRQRPANLREALAKQNPTRLAGEKMKMDGGVKRTLDSSSLDTKAAEYGSYDEALILAIQNRWYSLLDERTYASDGRGRVVLRFKLHPDGRVSDLTVSENGVGEMLGLICQKAVLDPQPYAPWTTEMRRIFGTVRNIQFTFHYN